MQRSRISQCIIHMLPNSDLPSETNSIRHRFKDDDDDPIILIVL